MNQKENEVGTFFLLKEWGKCRKVSSSAQGPNIPATGQFQGPLYLRGSLGQGLINLLIYSIKSTEHPAGG